jgi:hypothetical protein
MKMNMKHFTQHLQLWLQITLAQALVHVSNLADLSHYWQKCLPFILVFVKSTVLK